MVSGDFNKIVVIKYITTPNNPTIVNCQKAPVKVFILKIGFRKFKTAKHPITIIMLANKILPNDLVISFKLKSPIFLYKNIIYRIRSKII